jgi:hypothetical protein
MGRYAGEEYGDCSVSENSWRQLKTELSMMESRAIKAETERNALQASLERVNSLADEWDEQRTHYPTSTDSRAVGAEAAVKLCAQELRDELLTKNNESRNNNGC